MFNFSLPETTPEMLKDFLNLAMRESKLIHVSAPDPIIACRLTHTNAIIKFANPEDCTKGLNLNGIPFLSKSWFCPSPRQKQTLHQTLRASSFARAYEQSHKK